jgi:hypothetical protein
VQARFTSVDPLEIKVRQLLEPQNLNRYTYVTNNPLRYFDPDGKEKIEVIVRTFIPHNYVMNPAPLAGDGRNVGEEGTFRTEQRVIIETDPSKNGGNPAYGPIEGKTGQSYGLVLNSTETVQAVVDYINGGLPRIPLGPSKAPGNTLDGEVTRSDDGLVNVHLYGSERYQGIPNSPGITYNLDIKVVSEGAAGNVTVTVSGSHDAFPAYEVIIIRPDAENNGPTVVNSFDPRDTGNTGWSLLPFAPDVIIPPTSVVVPPKKPPANQ